MPLLEIEDLNVWYAQPGSREPFHAVQDVSLCVNPGECVGLVGESGSGKTTLGRAVLRLVNGRVTGRIRYEDQDVLSLRGPALTAYRRQAQMMFQDPMGSLNPRMTVGRALGEVLTVHRLAARAEVPGRVAELLGRVGLNTDSAGRYPHEFSGGQRQRIVLARALALNPRLLIADEPVSALDVSVQVQILNLLKELQHRLGLACLLVAHDLAVVRYVCDRLYVMCQGKVVEAGEPETVFAHPQHPYTAALLAAAPSVD